MADQCKKKQGNIRRSRSYEEEVCSIEWQFIDMSEQEEDLICKMHKLVGDRWSLIAGRIPGRKAEEIERYWLMRNSESFQGKWKQHRRRQNLSR